MAGKKTAVFGIYHTRIQAERSVDDLLAAGFANDDISVLLPDIQGSKDFAHEKNTKAPEGTTAGVTTGGAIGGTLGLLAGIGALAIPGVGPFIAAGPIMGALCRPRSRRRGRRSHWGTRWDGHARVRSEEVRRTNQRGRSSTFRSLRHIRGDHSREGSVKAHGRPRHFVVWRSQRGLPSDRQGRAAPLARSVPGR